MFKSASRRGPLFQLIAGPKLATQMAETFEFAVAVETVPDSAKEVAQSLRSSPNPEDAGMANDFVEGQFRFLGF